MARGSNKNMDLVLEQGQDLISFYRENPTIAAYDLCRADLAPIQRVVFNDMWFKNYVIAVMGRGGGKTFMQGLLAVLSCLLYPGYRVGLIAPTFRQCFPINTDSYDTFWTSEGLKTTTKEFYESISINNTEVQSLNSSNIITNKWLNEERNCIKIITEKGYEISGTVDHKILILSNDLSLKYKQLQDITENDYIVIKLGFNYFGNKDSLPKFDYDLNWRNNNCDIPVKLTPDLSYLFGLIVGDGCVSFKKESGKYRVGFVNNDKDLLESFKIHLSNHFGINIDNILVYERENETFHLECYNKKLCSFLLECGFTKTTALDKKVPEVIKKASRKNVIAFLQGLFDTDGSCHIQNHSHGYPHCEVSFNTSSLQLAKEVQAILLNIGVMSNLGVSRKSEKRCLIGREKKSTCSTGYKVRITSYYNLNKFGNIVNFRSERKKNMLDGYIRSCNLKINNLIIPDKNKILSNFIQDLKTRCKRGTNENKFLGKLINRFKSSNINGLTFSTLYNVLVICEKLNYENGIYFNLKNILESEYVFLKPKEFSNFKSQTIDVEVENEHCYWANGFINHNSKMMFSEVEKLYSKSNIIREACEKKPTRGTDTCYLKFKAVGGYSGSYIEALPLGVDGAKIRGSRFYLICVDELAQVPDKVLDLVVRPFAAVSLEPMENVRRLEHQKQLIEQGLAAEDDFEDETVNKMIMTSSGFFKFNHMWRRMKDHWVMMDRLGEESKHVVHQIPYWFLPDGFLVKDSIIEAQRVMSSYEFKMEYEAAMISDSEGFFKASLLEECTMESGFNIELRGDPEGRYVVGVDPNQGGDASCGIVIIKLGVINKVVNVLELRERTTQGLTEAVQKIYKAYNVVRIFIDKGGGGKAVMDLLEDGYDGHEPLIDRTDKDKRHLQGMHVLEMVNFNPSWIADANFTTLSLLEEKRLRFPEPPASPDDRFAIIYEKINKLKSQMLNIIVTQTASGLLHFDTPKKGQNKDLYSALILAAHGARAVERELEEEGEPTLFSESGMIRGRGAQASWNPVEVVKHASKPKIIANSGMGLEAAVLKKRIK